MLCSVLAGLSGTCNAQAEPGGYVIYAVPHSHIDLEWYWTYDRTEIVTINILGRALRLLKEDPNYAFTQDELQALKPFWDNLSDADRVFLRRMIREGRFEVATGMYVQPDIGEPDYESLTRQFLLAKPWLEKTLGANILTSWNLDTYGQTIQMPQLSRQGGLRYFVFSRDVPPELAPTLKSPYYWESPDGSKVLAYWLAASYVTQKEDIDKNLRTVVEHNLKGNNNILLLWGSDRYIPNETSQQIKEEILKAAARDGILVKSVIVTTPHRYFEDVIKSGVAIPTYNYDFNPPLYHGDLRGQYGECIDAKIAERSAEDRLESAEKFSTIASTFGLPYPVDRLRTAWEKVLFNQDHGVLPGDNNDQVYYEMMSRYSHALETGRSALAEAVYYLSRKINTSKGGDDPFLIFNSLSYPRTELARYETQFDNLDIQNFRILDPKGHAVPFRFVATKRWTPHSRFQTVIEFVADQVAPLGYDLYRIEPVPGLAVAPEWRAADNEVSNRFYALRLDPATGEIASLIDRRTGSELLDTRKYQGNEVVLDEEKDPDTEGITHFTGTEIRTSPTHPSSIEEITDALGTRLRIVRPFLGGTLTQEIKLYNDLPRVDFETSLLGFPGHDGMLSVVFPLQSQEKMKNYYETNNTVTERPDGIYQALTWVDLEGSGRGLAILNQGTSGYEIENGVAKLMLLRSITHYQGYYAPQAAQKGSYTFKYSLYSHEGNWADGGVVEQAHSYNSPLHVLPTDAHPGVLPPDNSFLAVETGHFEVTALKKAEQGAGFILRGYETHNKAEQVSLTLKLAVREAQRTDLLERSLPSAPIAIKQGAMGLTCKPSEFVTVRLVPSH
jgi:alpha-mannosidase